VAKFAGYIRKFDARAVARLEDLERQGAFQADQEAFYFSSEDHQARFSLLAYAVLHNQEQVVERLLRVAPATVNIAVVSQKPEFNGHAPLMIACWGGDLSIVRRLVEAGADLKHQAADGKNVFALIQKQDMFEYLVAKAKEQNCLAELFHPQVLSNFMAQGHWLLADLLVDALSEQADWQVTRQLLHAVRQFYFETGKSEAEVLCQGLRTVLAKAVNKPEFSERIVNARARNTVSLVTAGLDIRHVQFHNLLSVMNLLDNLPGCLEYLNIVENKFQEFYRHEHQHAFPRLNRDQLQSVQINDLVFPLPPENFQSPKKYSALKEFLLGLLKQQGLVSEITELVAGEEPTHLLSESIDLVPAERRNPSLFQGKFSYMLQMAMLVVAVQQGRLQLDGSSLKELLTYVAKNKNIWDLVFGARLQDRASFRDPCRLNSILMDHAGVLSDYAVASFCKLFLKQFLLQPHCRTPQEFSDKLADLILEVSLAQNWRADFKEPKQYLASDFFRAPRAEDPAVPAKCCVLM